MQEPVIHQDKTLHAVTRTLAWGYKVDDLYRAYGCEAMRLWINDQNPTKRLWVVCLHPMLTGVELQGLRTYENS